MERLWVAYYPDIIKNAVALVSQTTDNPEEVNLNAIGRILKVEAFLKLTDYYGDIPYFEAGKIYNENIVKPRYDKQEDIYMDFLSELRARLRPTGRIGYGSAERPLLQWRHREMETVCQFLMAAHLHAPAESQPHTCPARSQSSL